MLTVIRMSCDVTYLYAEAKPLREVPSRDIAVQGGNLTIIFEAELTEGCGQGLSHGGFAASAQP